VRAGWQPLRRVLPWDPRACVPVVCLECVERSAHRETRPTCSRGPGLLTPVPASILHVHSIRKSRCLRGRRRWPALGQGIALPEQACRRRINLGLPRVYQELPKERLLSGSTSAIASRLRALWTSSAVEWASVSWAVQSIVERPQHELGTLGTVTSRTSAAAALRLGGSVCSYSASHAGVLCGYVLLSSRHW
ncbi:LSU ribosomal protein L10P, partial [Giardia duodenalis]